MLMQGYSASYNLSALFVNMLNLSVYLISYISIATLSNGVLAEKVNPAVIESTNPTLANEQILLEFFGGRDPDEAATCAQLIASRGFQFERHYVTTADGYILQNYRIINPYARESGKPLKPVLLLHGLSASCSAWLYASPGGHIKPWINGNPPNDTSDALGFLLANLGYDVWLINFRGNTYSTNHTYLDPRDPKFYDFSFNELGIYDVTSTVDHIIKETGFNKIIVIGHSLGSTALAVQLSVMPKYEENYEVFVLAAPIVFFGSVDGFYRVQADQFNAQNMLDMTYGPTPATPAVNLVALVIFCRRKIALPICASLLQTFSDYNKELQNLTRSSVFISQSDITSTKNTAHLYQTVEMDQLSYFDYGEAENIARYGTPEPPVYPFYNIYSRKMGLITSLGDAMADPLDIQKFRNSLCYRPCVDHIVTEESFGHVDFVRSTQAYRYFGSVVVDLIKQCADYELQYVFEH